jgi:hypothetical protein
MNHHRAAIVCALRVAAAFTVLFPALQAPAQTPAYEPGAAQKLAADTHTYVDCLLPGVVRRLGAGVTYLAARKPQVLKVADCEVRGGEYVLYDRADPKVAFKIWESAANSGDSDAQRRLAQIYEMGLGGEPDYQSAASWYRKSAEQGNQAAAMALAALYETGLGVAKDPAEARRWYERARTPGKSREPGASRDVERLNLELRDKEKKLAELEAKVAQGAAASQAEIARARQEWLDSLKTAAQQATPAALLEPRRERPVIEVVDPNLVRTGATTAFNVRGAMQVKKITGWVNLGARLSGVTVNSAVAELDRNGFFSQDVMLTGSTTPVSIVAVSKDGKRDELNFSLRSVTSPAPEPVPALRDKPPAGVGRLNALVIGNNTYSKWPKLETAVEDARTIAGVLSRKYGYKTNVLIDATADEIISALNDYVASLRENDVLIVYYAGHGMLDTKNKRAHWIPVNGETDRDTFWIPSYRVTDLVNKMRAKKVLVISDSCYSGGLAADLTGVVSGVRPGLSEDGKARAADALWEVVSRTILTSGMLAPVLDDEGAAGKSKHSLFAKALLEVLDEARGMMTGDGLYTAVHARVVYRSQKMKFDQAPFYTGLAHAGHEGGDFLFVPVAAR